MPAPVDRRRFLASIPALMTAHRLMAQGAAPQLRATALSQLTLSVSDPRRSIEFYQGLFGMLVQAQLGSTTLLRIGLGPHYLAITPTAPGEQPSISRFGIGLESFEVDAILKVLSQHGVMPDEYPRRPRVGAMRVRVTAHGRRGNIPEIVVGDPAGINFQLQDASYCGGDGALGNRCVPLPSPSKGLMALKEMSHFTINSPSAQFYTDVFGLPVQAMQATTPAYGVGPGVHFLMFTGGARGGAGAPAAIDHACMSMDNFVPETVTKALIEYGLKPGARSDGPLVTYISLRMENRGGAPGTGTPELYFTDPDGLVIQLQDSKYCGGGGYLGEVCPAEK
jgi:catechol 2,3-dioxygenase-like lactoylglutathione lyase family enzyme